MFPNGSGTSGTVGVGMNLYMEVPEATRLQDGIIEWLCIALGFLMQKLPCTVGSLGFKCKVMLLTNLKCLCGIDDWFTSPSPIPLPWPPKSIESVPLDILGSDVPDTVAR